MIDEMLAYNREFVKSGAYKRFATSKYPDKKIAILTLSLIHIWCSRLRSNKRTPARGCRSG